MCNGKLVQTFYAASNGGYTDIPQHVWTASATLQPYHIVREDPYDVQNSWSNQEVLIFPKNVTGSSRINYKVMKSGSMVAGSGKEAANAERYLKVMALPAVRAKGYIADVTSDIEIVGFDRMVAHTYEGNHGIADYTGKRNCVCFTRADVTMRVKASRFATEDERLQTGRVYVDETVTVTFTIDMHKLDESGGAYQAFTNTSLRLFVIEETSGSWNLYHRRYGHGIGMSQRGAQERARAGHSYRDILMFYYPNTTLETLTIAPPKLKPAEGYQRQHQRDRCQLHELCERRRRPQQYADRQGDGERILVLQANVGQVAQDRFRRHEAYISADYVELDPTTNTNATIVNCVESVNVRSTPSTQYAAIGKALAGRAYW